MVVLVVGLVFAGFALQSSKPPEIHRGVVLVELFTSEGCSSCPPADALLSRLREKQSLNGIEVIPLGFHVDYWNSLGWMDRFSSRSYSERQEKYARQFGLEGPYTPQMVVDGSRELVGNNSRGAEDAILKAAGEPPSAEVTISSTSANEVLIRVQDKNPKESGDVMLAISEDNLETNVKAGENNGHVLRHAAVVRDFERLGRLSGGSFERTIQPKAAADWKTKDVRLVVFVQDPSKGSIAGAASIPWTSLSR